MTRARNIVKLLHSQTMRFLPELVLVLVLVLGSAAYAQQDHPYTTYTDFSQVLKGSNARYLIVRRVSDPGPSEHRAYTGFFFYQCLQFDTTGRYMLGMRVYFQNRPVQSS